MEESHYASLEMDTGEQEDWEDEEDYEEDDDADIDAEALEIARRLGEQLWADITKVTAEGNASSTSTAEAPSAPLPTDRQNLAVSQRNRPVLSSLATHPPRKDESIISTMKAILALVEADPLAKSALRSSTIPNGPNVLDILVQCTTGGGIAKGIAGPLSQVIVTLARSSSLFGSLKQSNASAIQLDKGKRKRDEFDEGHYQYPHAYKRPYIPDMDLQNQVVEAVRIISHALGSSTSQTLDPSLISSIRLQLHQVFLFAVTSAALAGHSMHALQEIGGLIQVIGVLSGIQIGHSPENMPHGQPYGQGPSYPWNRGQPPSMTTDIGTAVYPCLVVGCHKTFSRLYSLRAHQRSHSMHRPFRCNVCPASFARNHDLKRHLRLHDKKAWKCEGCHKVFSRRDAIKRHKSGTKTRGPKSEICLVAEVIEVELEGEEGEGALREERRAKLWNGIVVSEASGVSASASQNVYRDIKTIDEGEINPVVISGAQGSVLGLHGILQVLVGNALGNPIGHPVSAPVDPSGGQPTLASVIARAQSQTVPSTTIVPSPLLAQGPVSEAVPISMNTSLSAAEEDSIQGQTLGESVENHQPLPSLSMYGLSDEQAQLLEIAIANAASAAQAQAEAEAALEEEEEEDYDRDDNEYDDSEMEQDKEPAPQ